MHFLVTGHTGFKGAWLSLLLRSRGHVVSGLALDPVPDALYTRAEVAREMRDDHRIDVRDRTAVIDAFTATCPEVVIHMAAQALVRDSLKNPRATIETNVFGTMNVLEAVSSTNSVKAHVVVTTDKVYRNVGHVDGYVEDDPLGGEDPYSASKAMVEILTHSWVQSFSPCPTATARAGNVIGGGDVSRDRLLPDLVSALGRGQPALIRYPDAVRPWQHVLDAVSGYLALVDALLNGDALGEGWNFGPDTSGFASVRNVADQVVALWGDGASWVADPGPHPAEAKTLTLDATKSRNSLGWQQRLTLASAIRSTLEWHKRVNAGETPASVTRSQVSAYEARTPGEPMAASSETARAKH